VIFARRKHKGKKPGFPLQSRLHGRAVILPSKITTNPLRGPQAFIAEKITAAPSLRGAFVLSVVIASGGPEAIHPLTGGAYAIRIALRRAQ
jgi:hypothetical protein